MPDKNVAIEGDIEQIQTTQGDRLRVRIKRSAQDAQGLQGDRPPTVMFDARIPVEDLPASVTGLAQLSETLKKFVSSYHLTRKATSDDRSNGRAGSANRRTNR